MAKKIMVVDDDPGIVEYLVGIFRDHGYATCRACDGVSGFETAMAERPDLIVLDIEMPHEAGPRLYRRLSDEPDFPDVPLVVISGLAGIHLAIRGAVATIRKPFAPVDVVRIVREPLGE